MSHITTFLLGLFVGVLSVSLFLVTTGGLTLAMGLR